MDWGLGRTPGPQCFRFTWRETGGPAVKPPSKQGFGSWLIQRGLPDAQAVLEYPGSGAVCTITLPAGALKGA